MLSKIKLFFFNLFLSVGYKLSPTTNVNKLKAFFSTIHPVAIDKELIRVGGEGDGGYLLPDDLENIEACFSPGVGTVSMFEQHLSRLDIKSYMADHFIESSPGENPLFNFEKKFLGVKNNQQCVRLKDWVEDNITSVDSDLILQMDIEGSEYAALLDTPRKTLQRFRIMVIEFHSMTSLFDNLGINVIKPVFDKILDDFSIVHIHPNNSLPILTMGKYKIPSVMEFTFYRNDRVKKIDKSLSFPHPLDSRNDPTKSDIVLPRCWW